VYLLNPERFPEAVSYTIKENLNLKFEQSGHDTTDRFIFSALAENGYQRLSEILSFGIESNMISMTELASRGVMQSGLWVLLGSSMPAVLVECGYLSDPGDEKYLSSDGGQTAVAKGLYEGFVQYKMIYETQ
jgi:N-acetylmuramoyl-L-alanine amidase